MRLTRRLAPVLFSGMLSAFMVAVVSAAVLLQNDGPTPDFLPRWSKSFARTWPVAFPAVLVVAPVVRRVVARLTTQPISRKSMED